MPLPPLHDPIAAIATPPGQGAVGVVRLSGRGALDLAARVWQGRPPTQLRGGQFAVGQIVHQGQVLDQAVLLVFRQPRSYTGQDSVEFQTHGSPAVLRGVLSALLAEGARLAQPGEFSLRAYLNGRMDLAQAESVLSLIQSESEAGRRQALRGLTRELSQLIHQLAQPLYDLLAHLQAWLDYPEEGVEPAEIAQTLAPVLRQIDQLLATAGAGQRLRTGARLALVGAPNAGKSSLLNALLGYQRALVTDRPGTTRDYLEAPLELEGIPVVAVDTAGLRETSDPIEQAGVERAREIGAEADLVLFLADATQPLDWPVIELDPARSLFLATKADLPPLWHDERFLAISSQTGQGLPELRRRCAQILLGGAATSQVWVLHERHQQALQQARQSLLDALEAPADLAALSVQQALEQLNGILGLEVSEEVIERVFQNFCVGK